MSRLIVKNLPNNISEDRLRDLFSLKGQITDIQLKFTPSGKFRNFAYVGYKSECEAKEALRYFQNNYVDNKKISIEFCSELADPEKPVSWSKYAADNKQKQKEALLKKIKNEKCILNEQNLQKNAEIHQKILDILNKYENDPLFKEFMILHKMDAEKLNKILIKFSKTNEKKALDKSVSDLEYMKSVMKFSSIDENNAVNNFKKESKVAKDLKLFTIKIRGLPAKCKKKDLKEFFRPNLPFSVRIPRGDVKGFAYVTFKTKDKMKKALNKHKSFINGKQVFLYEFNSNNNNKTHEDESNENNSRWKRQETSLANEEGIAESGKIFVRNLAYTVTEQDLREIFEQYGEVSEVSLPIDKITRKIKGFGTVTFMMPEHAALAYTKLDGSILQGRLLHLLPAKTSENIEENDKSNMSYKKKKEADDKLKANLSYNWNTLFMSYGNVASAISDTYDIPIENIFDPWTKTSPAVRLALGETELVAKMKQYLEENGVCLDVFGQPITARSYNTIIVKNLPYGTTRDEIVKMFEPFGVLERVILPPKAVTAIVEFVEPFEARLAFQNFAYSRLKNSLLKLEWAPENIFSNKIMSKNKMCSSDRNNQQLDENCNNNAIEDNCEDIKPEAESTLYVKNLSFDTTEDELKKHFSKCGQIHSVIISYNKSSKLLEKKVSNGYGFVQFKLKANADEALKTLQYSVLDGRSIELKRSEKTLNLEVKTARKTAVFTKPTGTKLLIKNVPFRANIKELRDLFQAFGPLRSLRLPLKSSYDPNSHRGFAFVDYQLQTDANNAFRAMSASTHLFGRRLVLEWAAIDEDINDIRKRTAKNYHPSEGPLKKNKTVMSIEADNHDEEEEFVDNF